MEDLAVCAECGWHRLNYHVCLPEAGRAADVLARRVKVPSTKLGYGEGKLTFLLGEGKTLTFALQKGGSFRVDGFHWLDSLPETSAAQLATLLGAFAKGDELGR